MKSISKLIVAGLSLAVSMSAYADINKPMKATASKAGNLNVGVSAKLPAPQGKQAKGIKDLTRNGVRTGVNKVATPQAAHRPGTQAVNVLKAPAHVPAASSTLYGISVFSEDDYSTPPGFYGLSSTASDNTMELLYEDGVVQNTAGACVGGGYYYVNIFESFWGWIFGATHYVYDLETWELVREVDDYANIDDTNLIQTHFSTDQTYDTTTDLIYGCFYNYEGNFMFASQDPETFETTKIVDLDCMWVGVAAAPNGTIYAIDEYGNLLQADKTTGDLTLIGHTGLYPKYLTSATIDPRTGVMYFTLADATDGGYMTTIDLTTGEGTILYAFEDANEVVGLGIDSPKAEAGAPDVVEDLAVTFNGELRVGEVSFKMPTKAFDGSDLTMGAYEYTVVRNKEIIKQDRAFAGSEVKFVEVVPATGRYAYSVYVTNEEGKGPETKISLWVGPDNPVAPKNVELTYENGVFVATWDAVDSSVHSAFVPENVTYNVALYRDGAMVAYASEIEGTEYTFEDVPVGEVLATYSVSVEASTPAMTSDFGVSTNLNIGYLVPPVEINFDDPANLDLFTIIDANGDGLTWQYYGNGIISVLYSGYDDMDDWLISPAVYLEAGKEYTFSMNAAAAASSYPERIEAAMGTEPTVDGMSTIIIDPVDLLDSTFETYSGSFIAQESGEYYFGVHGISDADMLYLYLSSIAVSAGVSAKAPDAPALNVVANVAGELKATVNYTAPTTDINGDPTTISKVVITVDGEVVATNNDVKAGESYSEEVNVANSGAHTFTATAYNANGGGRVASQTVYVGINVPGVPTNVVLVAGEGENGVVATWDAPTVDINGYYLNPELVTYTVLDNTGEIIAAGIDECTISFEAGNGAPGFAAISVYAETAAGYSEEPGVSGWVPVGAAQEMPYSESFIDGDCSTPMASDTPDGSNAYWMLADDSLVPDSDGTNGLAAMISESGLGSSNLLTARIQLNENPYLSFAYYNIDPEDANTLQVYVTDYATHETKLVKTVAMGEGAGEEWIPVMVSLSEYAGKVISLTFEGTINLIPGTTSYYGYVIIDQIQVYTPLAYDLAVADLQGPALVAPDTEFEMQATVKNLGLNAVDAYQVELLCNGESVATVDAGASAPGQIDVVTFTCTLPVIATGDNIYTAKLICEQDLNASNNVSPEYPVEVDVPNYPKATDLKATAADGGISLTWTAPNLDPENMPYLAITDDFESYAPFAIDEAGEWTFVDADGEPVGGVQGLDFPGITIGTTALAYFVMNTDEIGATEYDTYTAHSGFQYMVSLFSARDYDISDWMISPELSGEEQTISFYAKSFSASYPESFNVYYSSTDTELESFTMLKSVVKATTDWTQYSVKLPVGAKYFAIANESAGAFMLFVDDVTYIPANAEKLQLDLVGFNIYRNGEKINAEPVAEASYVDAEGSANDEYVVTVVYAQGESGASEAASASAVDPGESEGTGISSAVASKAVVKVVGRQIVVTGAQGNVNVYTADGKALYNAAAEARNTVTVAPGIYVVKAGKFVQKVIVK